MVPLAEEPLLFIFAQVAVLFAGFGGVSIVLGKLQSAIELARLRNVIITAFLLLLLSLFPVLLNQFGLEPEIGWRLGTGVFAFIMIIFYVFSGDVVLFKEANTTDRTLMIGDGVLVIFLVAGTLGFTLGFAAKIYLAALYWHLFCACMMFVMVFSPIWRDADLGSEK
jgi:hypothetical protein